MSGIEAAGIVLGIFPIVVNGLQQFAEGVETIRAWKSYRKKIERYSRILETEEKGYVNTIEILLEGIIESHDEIAAFMKDPGAAFPQHGDRLSARLGRAYGNYSRIMADMLYNLNAIRQELGIDENGKILWDGYSSLERQLKRVKLALSKNRYMSLISEIKEANLQLSKFNQDSHILESNRKKRRSKRQLVDFKVIRRQARSLYNVLVTGRSWTCRCWKYHVASLRLEPRPWEGEKGGGKATEAPRLKFTVLISKSCPDDGCEVIRKWQELEIEPVETSESPIAGFEKDTQAMSIAKLSLVSSYVWDPQILRLAQANFRVSSKPLVKKAVKFAVTSPAETNCSPAPIKPSYTGTSPIDDICSAVSKDCGVKHIIGFLIDESIGQHRHHIYSTGEKIQQGVSPKSLEDLLQASKHQSLGFNLSRRDRLYIAVTLASSVLQLVGTLWLKTQWNSGDILFLPLEDQKTSAPIVDYAHPYVSWKISPDGVNTALTRDASEAVVAHRIPCEVLFMLGITLTELCFGQNIYRMRVEEDLDTTDVMTNFNTASRLIDDVYSESGSRYGNVVRRCLKCPPDVRDASLDNEEFQEAIFESIITPLRQELEDFSGVSRIR